MGSTHMNAQTISKQELKQPDGFQRFFDRLATGAKKHAKMIWIVFAIIAVVATLILVQRQKNEKMNAAAANAYVTTLDVLTKDETNLSSESWEVFADLSQVFLDTYPKADMAPLMQLHRARALLHLEKYKEAVVAYEMAESKLPLPHRLTAQEGIAVSYQFQDEFDQSLQVWQRLVALEENMFKDFHLWNLGLNLEKVDKTKEALAVYHQLIEQYAESKYAIKAKVQIALHDE